MQLVAPFSLLGGVFNPEHRWGVPYVAFARYLASGQLPRGETALSLLHHQAAGLRGDASAGESLYADFLRRVVAAESIEAGRGVIISFLKLGPNLPGAALDRLDALVGEIVQHRLRKLMAEVAVANGEISRLRTRFGPRARSGEA